MTLALLIGLVAAYLIGAIPTGLLIGRWFAKVDLRTVGSKNIGFTNAWRVLGWRLAVPVLLLDIAKGLLAVLLLPLLAVGDPGGDFGVWCGLAALLGNLFNVFLGFRGGKGVATGLGVFIGLAPLAALVAFLVFFALVWATRYISLGALVAAVVLTVAIGALHPIGLLFWFSVATTVVIFAKHRGNISRLLAGTERRFGQSGSERQGS